MLGCTVSHLGMEMIRVHTNSDSLRDSNVYKCTVTHHFYAIRAKIVDDSPLQAITVAVRAVQLILLRNPVKSALQEEATTIHNSNREFT